MSYHFRYFYIEYLDEDSGRWLKRSTRFLTRSQAENVLRRLARNAPAFQRRVVRWDIVETVEVGE